MPLEPKSSCCYEPHLQKLQEFYLQLKRWARHVLPTHSPCITVAMVKSFEVHLTMTLRMILGVQCMTTPRGGARSFLFFCWPDLGERAGSILVGLVDHVQVRGCDTAVTLAPASGLGSIRMTEKEIQWVCLEKLFNKWAKSGHRGTVE